MSHAQPPLEFIPPAFNPLVLQMTQLVLPSWLRWNLGITQIQADNVEILVDLYSQFQEGKIRFMMAFRHPQADDPPCMMYLLRRLVPQVARQKGISLQQPIYAHFIYDRGIPLWAGSYVGWLYSRLGCTPIHRGKADLMGLRSARDLFANGSLPMAAAPEGATNGHNEIISPLEPGVAQLGFWCIDDLLKAGRSEDVLIVPVGIQYSYIKAPWQSLEKLLSELEADISIEQDSLTSEPLTPTNLKPFQVTLYQRLYRLGEHLLSLMEEFYREYYHQTLPNPIESEEKFDRDNASLPARIQVLLDTALKVAEEYFELPVKGNLIDRCRRLEQAGWNYIYREDFKDIKALSPIQRGLADHIASEASLRMWHMRLVETFVALTGQYVLEKPTVERFAETTLLVWDLVTRLKGGNPFDRPRLGKQRVKMRVGKPISVSEFYPAYRASRHGARQAIVDLTHQLQTSMESLIIT